MRLVFDFRLMNGNEEVGAYERWFKVRNIDVTKTLWTLGDRYVGRDQGAFLTEDGEHEVWSNAAYFRPAAPTKKLSEWV